jgi:hypothetical protein
MTTKTLSMLSLALLALPLGGCNGAFVGNFFVLFVSMGIFFGTLNLGRFSPGAGRMPNRDRSATESRS